MLGRRQFFRHRTGDAHLTAAGCLGRGEVRSIFFGGFIGAVERLNADAGKGCFLHEFSRFHDKKTAQAPLLFLAGEPDQFLDPGIL